ncbi:hypothetical protein B5M09_011986, partial [Aphanomyces astaci]
SITMLTVRQIVQHPSVVSTMQAINIEFPTLFRQEHHNLIWDIKGPLQASKYESAQAVLGMLVVLKCNGMLLTSTL